MKEMNGSNPCSAFQYLMMLMKMLKRLREVLTFLGNSSDVSRHCHLVVRGLQLRLLPCSTSLVWVSVVTTGFT